MVAVAVAVIVGVVAELGGADHLVELERAVTSGPERDERQDDELAALGHADRHVGDAPPRSFDGDVEVEVLYADWRAVGALRLPHAVSLTVDGVRLHEERRVAIALCDRGTIDGAAYWPTGPEGFFDAMGTSLATELARYDGCVFFETAAVGGLSIETGNPTRVETLEAAVALDHALEALWSEHPRFVKVRHDTSFFEKIGAGLRAIESVAGLRPHA